MIEESIGVGVAIVFNGGQLQYVFDACQNNNSLLIFPSFLHFVVSDARDINHRKCDSVEYSESVWPTGSRVMFSLQFVESSAIIISHTRIRVHTNKCTRQSNNVVQCLNDRVGPLVYLREKRTDQAIGLPNLSTNRVN